MKKWYEGVYRRQLTDMHINDTDEKFLSRFNADEYYANLVRAKIQAPMIYLQSHIGLCNYPTESARAHRKFACGEKAHFTLNVKDFAMFEVKFDTGRTI